MLALITDWLMDNKTQTYITSDHNGLYPRLHTRRYLITFTSKLVYGPAVTWHIARENDALNTLANTAESHMSLNYNAAKNHKRFMKFSERFITTGHRLSDVTGCADSRRCTQFTWLIQPVLKKIYALLLQWLTSTVTAVLGGMFCLASQRSVVELKRRFCIRPFIF